ncbi:MAG: efflux RND transporter permease subunit [bacterium]|nr:efflux RND transporter permease subunit [bacterium]
MGSSDSFLVRWSRFFIDKYRVTIIILIAILVAGLWGVGNNQRQDFPQIPTNFIFVQTVYPGASAADIEQEVIIPVEQAVDELAGVKSLRSNISNSFAFVTVEMEDVLETENAAETLSTEVAKLGLPSDAETSVEVLDPTGPSLSLGLVSTEDQTINQMLDYASEVRSRLLAASPGIEKIDIVPGNEFVITITLDASAVVQAGLSYDLVKSTIQSQLTSLPGGMVETESGQEKSIIIQAPVQSLDDLRRTSFGPVTLGDLAEFNREATGSSVTFGGYVKDGTAEVKEAVYFLVLKKADGDIIEISEAVRETTEEIQSVVLPEGMELVVLYDTSPFITDQISTLLNNGLLGLILILIVLLFFINFRAAVVVALIIPMVFLITLFMLAVMDFTLNILTLFAMILTLGILVDNAIVIAEGMVHEVEKGAKRREAALTSIMKLGPAVTAATLTTVVVFIPFASIGGIVGEFMKFIPYTIIIMLLSSYFLAVTITPLLGRWLLRQQTYEERRASRIRGWEKALVLPAIVHYGQNFIDWLSRGYRHFMTGIYASGWRKFGVIAVTAILLFGSLGIFAPQLKFEEFPTNDSDTILVTLRTPTGTTTETQKEIFRQTLAEVVDLPHFQTAFTYEGLVWATFTPPQDRKDGITINQINDELDERLNFVRMNFSNDIEIVAEPAGYGPPESEFDIIVEFLGLNPEALARASTDLTEFLANEEGVVETEETLVTDLQVAVEVDLDQDRLASQNVNSLAAAGTVNAVFSPQKIGSIVIRDDGVSDDVELAFADESTDSIEDLQNLRVPTLNGGTTDLNSVAEISEVERLASLARLNGSRVAAVNISVDDDTDPAAIEKKIRDRYTEEKLVELGLAKDGIIFGGLFATFSEDYGNLQIVFLLAMLLVYLILVYQFNSYIQPGLILFAVPLALIGVFPGLLLVGSSLNMISGLGVIALVGIVVNDAIVFIATYNRYREEMPEASFADLLVRTGHTRFKPIFSTSITTIGGILPLTILDPFWRGLGTSIISGLIFSTVGTLIAIPVLYSVWKSLGNRLKKRYSKTQ